MQQQADYYELNEDSKAEQLRHAEILRKYEAQKRARSINVPTAIEEVKARLREMGQPITLYGEGPADRRERLKDVIAQLELGEEELQKLQAIINKNAVQKATSTTVASDGNVSSVEQTSASSTTHATVSQEQMVKQKEVIYSAATDQLIAARKIICIYSFDRAAERLQKMKSLQENDLLQREEDEHVGGLYTNSKELSLNASQFGDDRPLTTVRYAPDGNLIASASLSSTVKLWDIFNLTCKAVLRGHTDRVTSIAWHPQASSNGVGNENDFDSSNSGSNFSRGVYGESEDSAVSMHDSSSSSSNSNNSSNSSSNLLASTAADGTCNLYDCRHLEDAPEDGSNRMDTDGGDDTVRHAAPVARLKGHVGVVTNCDFHPQGALLGTSGQDFSWRLWDIETSVQIQLQDGHITECSRIAFHPDGSLLGSGDAGGVVLLWDLRSGQCIQPYQGHSKKITAASFNANGYELCTSSADNTIKIWDLRQRKCSYTLPAHGNIISDARYSKSGELLLTSSFDGMVKVWGTRDYRILRSLTGHSGKVMSSDFSPTDEKHIISAGYDRTLKLWAHKDEF